MASTRETELLNDPLYAWLCAAIDNEMDGDQKTHLQRLKARIKLHWSTQRGWLHDAREALSGDLRSLRNRVDMAEAGPVEVVLSR